ncbi:hypothetical protein DAPPUDRAFT_272033 [Daphnia pulex]|uniref:MULE transposase domain-containing protein n=1 Tax=Daphnia pulex TaxID=6669 RepID=E9I2P5_DAPPU|nr:hypothetical protein DAPPUDRAFT_272033 [Daphnia pulex]|eukprot:EFX61735.1 hypothetical protein DAPPUDRAFT_272033 [Daphnia pulex]
MEFMMDFEAAMWQACKEVFPAVKPVGCSFHLTQSFYRNIKLIGLAPSYRKDSQTRKTCRELLSSKELLEALGNLTHKFSRAQLRELRNANGLDESD